MNNFATDANLPKGIHRIWLLPEPSLESLWDSIQLDTKLKDKLVSQAIVNFTVRKKVNRSVLPLHGVILLVGLPGTGKTSLAKGLANCVAQSFPGTKFKLLEVEPHSLTSSAMGKTQQAVSTLFSQTISETAALGPTIVLLDEVETLAADRSKLSLEANPVDIHRATDAVLVQLDLLAEKFPDLLFVATSNFPDAVDSAFTSRCDLVMEIPLPDKDACKRILQDCFNGLGKTFPAIAKFPESPHFDSCAMHCVGLDGRAIRKAIASSFATNKETAINPEKVTIEDVVAAVKFAKSQRLSGGKSK